MKLLDRTKNAFCYTLAHSFLVLVAAVAPSYARSLEEIKASKELRFCIVVSHPATVVAKPDGCRENCKFSGVIPEESKAFAAQIGVHAKMLRVSWDEQFFNKEGQVRRDASYTPELLASGKCDLYSSNLTKNEWRSKKMDFVILFPSRMMVIASKEMKGKIRNAADLAGKKAAMLINSSYHTWLLAENQTTYAANPIQFESMNTQESLAAVDEGKIDFTIIDPDIAIWATRHQLKNAKATFTVGPKEEIGWAFRKEDKDLQIAAQIFFKEQLENDASAFNQTWQNHFGLSLKKFVSVINSSK